MAFQISTWISLRHFTLKGFANTISEMLLTWITLIQIRSIYWEESGKKPVHDGIGDPLTVRKRVVLYAIDSSHLFACRDRFRLHTYVEMDDSSEIDVLF